MLNLPKYYIKINDAVGRNQLPSYFFLVELFSDVLAVGEGGKEEAMLLDEERSTGSLCEYP